MLMKYMPADIQTEFDRLGKLVDDVFRGRLEAPTQWIPRVDIKETPTEVTYFCEAPGFKEENLEVEITGNFLTIRGSRELEQLDEKASYVHVERRWGNFYRQFPLPIGLKTDKVSAQYKDGVLTVVVPREAKLVPHKVSVKKP